MLDGKQVAVVVPARDEEGLLPTTLAGIPEFVDRVYVVDDGSKDGTAAAAGRDSRVALIRHDESGGVGAAIVSGYKRALDDGVDVVAVMAADNQMDPADLDMLVGAVARGEVDYAKANRLFTGQAWELIPRTRYLGNAVLSMLTKIASGYWHVADSQSGFTAVGRETLELLDLDRLYRRYGFPNDMLVHLNVVNARVRDFPSRPREKYVIRDFHPLVFFYALGVLMTLAGLVLGIVETVLRLMGNELPVATIVLVALLLISGTQFTLFAMWFDMESNRDLR